MRYSLADDVRFVRLGITFKATARPNKKKKKERKKNNEQPDSCQPKPDARARRDVSFSITLNSDFHLKIGFV